MNRPCNRWEIVRWYVVRIMIPVSRIERRGGWVLIRYREEFDSLDGAIEVILNYLNARASTLVTLGGAVRTGHTWLLITTDHTSAPPINHSLNITLHTSTTMRHASSGLSPALLSGLHDA